MISTHPAVRTWTDVLGEEKNKPYFHDIMQFLKKELQEGKVIYPPQNEIFNAFKLTPFEDVKVVMIGQDPYHGPHQAHGLAFSVKPGIKPPPSLENIFKELENDVGIKPSSNGCLEKWAKQGVLLLNTCLTVLASNPQSHYHIGWQRFTDKVIEKLNDHPESIVYLLWGSHAQQKEALIDTSHHKILKAPHPSPLSAHRGFLGCRHFSKANALLKLMGREPIDWDLSH